MKSSKQTLLWQISGETLPGVSFLFGTMHVRNQRAFANLNIVYETIEQCEAFAAEADMNELGMLAHLHSLQLPDGLSLEDMISPKRYKKLRHIILKSLKVDIEPFKRMQPIIIANLLDENILIRDMPFALDQHLWEYAQGLDKTLMGVETTTEQMKTLESIPLDYQIQALLSIGRNPTSHQKSLLKAANWYENGNIKQLYKATRSGLRGLRGLMLYHRNDRMAMRIASQVKAQTTFCAVGAAHLWGEKGVLRYLKLAGLKIQPIRLHTPTLTTT